MKKVYVVIHEVEYEGESLMGIFEKEEDANIFAKSFEDDNMKVYDWSVQ